jgi:ElaB/YqjD/DUF883 family membrane-anchored ribosome-binding protein
MDDDRAEPQDGSERDALAELRNRLEAALDEVRPKIRRAFEELDGKVDAAIADLRPRAQGAVKEVGPKVNEFVADLQPRLDALLQRLQVRIDELRQDLDERAARSREAGRPVAEIGPGESDDETRDDGAASGRGD